MASHSQEQEESEELQEIIPKSQNPKPGFMAIDLKNVHWIRKDIYLMVMTCLVGFGDAVEIYLPGVITDLVSRELKVTKTQEGLLGIILYSCLALSCFVFPAIQKNMGTMKRELLLTSLYISLIVTVLCALVPNYWSLLISRGLLGFCIGLNMTVLYVYCAEETSSYDLYNVGNIVSQICFTLGGGWAAVLGYLLLERIGWRFFIVCSSVPIFLPPVLILHFELPKEEIEDGVQT